MENPLQINGFVAIAIQNDNGNDNENEAHTTYLFVKNHTEKHQKNLTVAIPEPFTASTLFVGNLPLSSTTTTLQSFFEQFGEVHSVYINHLKKEKCLGHSLYDNEIGDVLNTTSGFPSLRSIRVSFLQDRMINETHNNNKSEPLFFDRIDKAFFGLVCFQTPQALLKVLNAKPSRIFTWPSSLSEDFIDGHFGYKRWQDLTKMENQQAMKDKVDEYMKNFDQTIAEEKRERKKRETVPDDDGFVLVSHKNATSREENKRNAKRKLQKEEREKKFIEFYGFQRKEKKRERIADLRKRFEKDKERISKMRQNRKFKPY